MGPADRRRCLPHFRVLRHDLRGHGASDAPPGEYTIEQLARDVLAIADRAAIGRFAFCGLSLGGMIGQWLGANAGERLTHLVLANTSPRLANPTVIEERRKAVLGGGMAAIVDAVIGRFFTPEPWPPTRPDVASTRRTLLATNPAGYAGCCAAIRDMDHRPLAARNSRAHAGHRRRSRCFHSLGGTRRGAGAVHPRRARRSVFRPRIFSNIERPRSFTAALLDFLLPRPADRLEAGFADAPRRSGRRARGSRHRRATDFTRDFQELITRYAWGTVWTRPGLTRARAACWCSPPRSPSAGGKSFACTSAPAWRMSWNRAT